MEMVRSSIKGTQSLINAIKNRYDFTEDSKTLSTSESSFFIHLPKRSKRKNLTNIVINRERIDCAGNEEELAEICGGVFELDLAWNELKDWSQVNKKSGLIRNYLNIIFEII